MNQRLSAGAKRWRAFAWCSEGKLAEAEDHLRETLEGRERGNGHSSTLVSKAHLGDLYMSQGRHGEAEGRCLIGLERYAEAEAALLEAREILIDAVGAGHFRTVKMTPILIELYDTSGGITPAAACKCDAPQEYVL